MLSSEHPYDCPQKLEYKLFVHLYPSTRTHLRESLLGLCSPEKFHKPFLGYVSHFKFICSKFKFRWHTIIFQQIFHRFDRHTRMSSTLKGLGTTPQYHVTKFFIIFESLVRSDEHEVTQLHEVLVL